MTALRTWIQARSTTGPTRSLSDWNFEDSKKLIVIIGVLIVVLVACGGVLMYLRRKTHERESSLASPGTVMEELRRLRKQGVLSEREYEASRRAAAMRLAGGAGGTKGGAGGTKGGAGGTKGGAGAGALARAAATAPAQRQGKPGESRVAKPGLDLTGAPLPKSGEHGGRGSE